MKEKMTLIEAMQYRTSRRSYRPEPLSDADQTELKEAIGKYSGAGYRMEIVKGALKSGYGMFSGVNNVILMIASSNDTHSEEKLGYFGELAVLEATALGYGTCWMGMYDTKSAPAQLQSDERAVIAITIGHVDEPKAKEKLIRSIAKRRTKPFEQLTQVDAVPPDWFIRGVEAVQLAPSAMNRQPVVFIYQDGDVKAVVKDIKARSMALDLGIAKAHFALASNGVWEWGNNGRFIKA